MQLQNVGLENVGVFPKIGVWMGMGNSQEWKSYEVYNPQ